MNIICWHLSTTIIVLYCSSLKIVNGDENDSRANSCILLYQFSSWKTRLININQPLRWGNFSLWFVKCNRLMERSWATAFISMHLKHFKYLATNNLSAHRKIESIFRLLNHLRWSLRRPNNWIQIELWKLGIMKGISQR